MISLQEFLLTSSYSFFCKLIKYDYDNSFLFEEQLKTHFLVLCVCSGKYTVFSVVGGGSTEASYSC